MWSARRHPEALEVTFGSGPTIGRSGRRRRSEPTPVSPPATQGFIGPNGQAAIGP